MHGEKFPHWLPHLAVKRVKQWVQAGRDVPTPCEAVEVEALVQGAVRGHGEESLVRALRHALLLADCTRVEGVDCLVTIQVSTPGWCGVVWDAGRYGVTTKLNSRLSQDMGDKEGVCLTEQGGSNKAA